jgi:Uma2 family endonuclease
MITTVSPPVVINKSVKRKIPAYLIRETIDGIPFYYAGYKDVINRKKTLEDIMADSGLQSIIKAYLMILFAQKLDLNRFQPVSGEIGSHLDHRSNLALDVAVYDNTVLTPEKINLKYIDVNPKIVVEIDVRVKLEDPTANPFEQYVLRKVKKLLAFGTERVIWIFTQSDTIIVAKPGNSWEVFHLNQDVMLLEEINMNIGNYLNTKGIYIAGLDG